MKSGRRPKAPPKPGVDGITHRTLKVHTDTGSVEPALTCHYHLSWPFGLCTVRAFGAGYTARPICRSAFRHWSASLALPDCAPTMPSADFRLPVGGPCGPPSPRGASGGSPGVFPAASARDRRIYVMRFDNWGTSDCVAPSSRAPRLTSASLYDQPALSPTAFSPLPSRGYSCPRLPFGVACLGSDLRPLKRAQKIKRHYALSLLRFVLVPQGGSK